jgi:GDP-mannose 6-dehydrogenase
MKICLCGLGYVGSVTAACLARAGHTVIGVDINPDKAGMIGAGIPPVLEEGLPELFAEAARAGRLTATTDLRAAADADATLVAVGTPSRQNGSLDTSALESVCAELGAVISGSDRRHTVVIRSTVLPGTTRGLLIPILEQAAGRPLGETLGVCYNPEFLREGTGVADFYSPPFTVIGGDDGDHIDVAGALYAGVEAPIERTRIETAEMLKYACNAFHALKIGFANEIGNFAADHGVDGREVMRLLGQDSKLNVSTAYLRPGFAFGGSCLPKDLRALTHRARQSDLSVPLLNSLLESNREQVRRGYWLVTRHGKRRIGLLGLTFKSGTDDLRESPFVDLAETLIGKGFDVRIHDSNLAPKRLVGANERFILEHLPHFGRLLGPLASVTSHADVLVVCKKDPAYEEAVRSSRPDQQIVDLAGLPAMPPEVQQRLSGIAW